MLYPEIADWAFVDISPLKFVNKLMAANPDMPMKMLTCENIKYTFVREFISAYITSIKSYTDSANSSRWA